MRWVVQKLFDKVTGSVVRIKVKDTVKQSVPIVVWGFSEEGENSTNFKLDGPDKVKMKFLKSM